MEEKERKQLKKRLLGLVINEPPYPYPITMAEVMVNDMSKPNLKPLLNFIEKELDKAREEGRREVIHKLKEEIDMAEVSKFIDVHQGFFNSFGESVLLKISKLTTK